MIEIRQGSDPEFCPPSEEGICIALEDESGDVVDLEFLGLVLDDARRYGFFFPLDEDAKPLDSGEVVVLEVIDVDEDGQPVDFQLVEDVAIAKSAYDKFKRVTRDIYKFE